MRLHVPPLASLGLVRIESVALPVLSLNDRFEFSLLSLPFVHQCVDVPNRACSREDGLPRYVLGDVAEAIQGELFHLLVNILKPSIEKLPREPQAVVQVPQRSSIGCLAMYGLAPVQPLLKHVLGKLVLCC